MYSYVYKSVDLNSDKHTHKDVDKGVYICYILIGGGNNGNNYFAAIKGGVGKTTLSYNFSEYLASIGKKFFLLIWITNVTYLKY